MKKQGKGDMPPIHVAIIDDNHLMREIINHTFDYHGYRVLFEAEDGISALEQLDRAPLLPDVCLVDIQMPRMNGFDTVKAIRQRFPLIKILIFSANNSTKDIARMLSLGVDGYIVKGADADDLIHGIATVHAGNTYFCALADTIVRQIRSSQL